MRNNLALAQFFKLTPYPGTRLFRQLLDENRLEPRFWLAPSWDSRVVFKPKTMSAQRLCANTHQVQRAFYAYRSIVKHISLHWSWNYWLAANLIYRHTIVASHSHA